MEYLVFETEQEAQQTERAIFNFGKQVAAQAGYTVTKNSIHGKVNGVSSEDSAVTTAWDVPRQRLDGKWVVVHPKSHPASQNPAFLNQMMVTLGIVIVEEENPSWWLKSEEI